MVGKPRRNLVTDEQIIAHYRESLSVFKTAVALGIGSTTAHRALLKHKIKLRGLQEYRRRITKFKGQEKAIRKMYDAGATYEQLSEKFGTATAYAFKHAIKRAGGVLRDNPAPLIKPGELEKIKKLHAQGLGVLKISVMMDRSAKFIQKVKRKHRLANRINGGSSHGMWRGGRYKDGQGYIRVWVSKDDPMAVMMHSDSHVLEHRLVMARKLKRPLLRTETVHHINGDRADNRPKNLQIRHGKHGKGAVMCCLDCGSRNIGHAKLD